MPEKKKMDEITLDDLENIYYTSISRVIQPEIKFSCGCGLFSKRVILCDDHETVIKLIYEEVIERS